MGDFDFGKGQADVLRSEVEGEIGPERRKSPQQLVPLDDLTLEELQSWKNVKMYASDIKWFSPALSIVTKPSISLERTAHGLARRQPSSPPTEP